MTQPLILINEDIRELREILVFQLESAGFRVAVAADGAETLRFVMKTPPDLVLTDIPVPDGDGLGLIAELHVRWPDLPVVVLTAKTTVGDKVTALDHGAIDYVTKPWDREELVVRLRNLVEWRRILTRTSPSR